MTWADLEAELRNGLRSRPAAWPVYIEGDLSLEFQWPAKVVDVVQGLHADAVLLRR